MNFVCIFRLFFLILLPFALPAEEEEPAAPIAESSPVLASIEQPPALASACDLLTAASANPKEGFTINYTTVSIVEYIKFASKVCNSNFLFNEEDLPFTVSVVSDAPITRETVMATLIQMLRIHGLMLIEEGNNLVIHKSSSVRQIASLVFEDGKNTTGAPIVTRLFRVKNANVDSIAAIIKPMISDDALLETSRETRQLILTDLTANVNKVACLIENLDSPHSPLEIRVYEAKFNRPEYLIDLASQIMTPIAQGHPFLLVPQALASSIFIVSTPELNDKAASILAHLDIAPKKSVLAERKIRSENVSIIKLDHRSGDDIIKALNDISLKMQESGIRESDLLEAIDSAQWISETNSILFAGTSEATIKLKEFIAALDSSVEFEWGKSSFFIYKPQNRPVGEIERAVAEIADNLSKTKGTDINLIAALRSAKVNPTTQTILFAGSPAIFPKVKDLLLTADTPEKEGKRRVDTGFYVYKIQSPNIELVQSSLKTFLKNLKQSGATDEGLIHALKTVKYIKETHSLFFTGSEDVLKRVREVIPQFDGGGLPASSQFLVYKPKAQKGEYLLKSLSEMAKNFKASHLVDPAFLRALESMRWVPDTNSLLFTGDPASLTRIEELTTSLDVYVKNSRGFFLYPPRYVSRERIHSYLTQLADRLDSQADADLIAIIRTMQWVDPTFLFNGSEVSLTRLKELLAGFDISSEQTKTTKPGYFLYKLQNTSGEVVETDLDHLLKKMQSSGLKETALAKVIENIRFVKETNSLLLTGEPGAIEEAKGLILSYDYPRAPGALATEFFLYKPQTASASQIEKSLKEVATNLHKADLADPNLLAAISSMKYVETTNSLLFAGTQDALHKIQVLLKDLDAPVTNLSSIQHVGKTTFLLYKLHYVSANQITSSINAVAEDLKKSGASDVQFVKTLETLKYVKETDSLLFTGTEENLEKIKALLEKFDTSEFGNKTVLAAPPTEFFVYKVQSRSGPELEKILSDFADDVRMSGLSDPSLFHTLQTMKYIDKTQSLVFTGDQKSLAHVKELLKEFDVPTSLGPGIMPTGEQPIQSIENTSFLVYKLQFHKGDEIQGALKQIGKDLMLANAPVSSSLLNSINSIQWLEVTNSLLCTGDQETLTRLRELVKNLDIPLKQVFIEVLILQTSLTNTLTFGLDWGSKFKYKNKFSGSISNINPTEVQTGGTGSTADFASNAFAKTLPTVNATTYPNPNMLPFSPDFNFGIIGDIITHKGETFVSLGSLLNALQDDQETVIVMTPKILAQDSKTSTIFSGQNIPFAGSYVSTTGNTTVQQSNLEYRDVGLNLSITPVLGNSDVITLDISLDKTITATNPVGSSISLGTGVTASGITTDRTTLQTTVHVPNGHFLILSGFVNNTTTRRKSGIPCLGGLPLIGSAFSQDNDTQSDYNMVIFMHPKIIHSLEDMKKLASDQEDYFRDQAGTPSLKKNFEEAMELIKSPEDD